MLEQILQDMFIDPDLLAELGEEQKQVLFCKMREEQVRRWQEAEIKLEKEEAKKKKKKKIQMTSETKKAKIDFLLGEDGEPWTWLMGEHVNDRSVEEILEDEQQQTALQMAQQESDQLRRKEEEELERKLKEEEAKLEEEEKIKEEKIRKNAENHRMQQEAEALQRKLGEEKERIRARSEKQRRVSMNDAKKLRDQRSSQIYDTFKEARRVFEEQAEESNKEIDEVWKVQEKKAKRAEEQMRSLARNAREEHRRSMMDTLRTESQIVGMMALSLKRLREGKENVKPAVTSKPMKGLASKPSNKVDVVTWFSEYEEPKGVGLEKETQQVAPWFHGQISRAESESLLQSEPVGSYLVRLSEKIWGYAISYRSEDRCKHFLVDASEGSYQFFGTNQLSHASLEDLVNFHKSKEISLIGKEMLQHPVGQTSIPPDYSDLLAAGTAESSYL